MTNSALTTLNGRLDRLEQEVRLWRRAGLGVFAVLALIALVAATSAKIPDEIRAKRFVVVEDGQVRAELGKLTTPGSGLVLNDARGSIRVRLIVLPHARQNPVGSSPPLRIEEETWLQLYDPETYGRVLLRLDNETGPELRLSGVRGPNAALGVSAKTGPYVQLYAGDGQVVWKAP